MSHVAVRRPSPGGKPPSLRQLAVEAAWDDWLKARQRAMTSQNLSAGIAAGRAWAGFLKLFERA